jgi:hypothetical protein
VAKELVPIKAQEAVESRLKVIRSKHVIIDSDLAEFYGVEVKRLNEQVVRNPERFPEDFAFQLSAEEWSNLKSQNATSSWGGRRKPPWVFTEQGAIQAAGVLRGGKAAEVSVAVSRAFVAMKQRLHAIEDLPAAIESIHDKLEELEENDADLHAKVEMIGAMVKQLGQAVKALDKAEKHLPQLESGRTPRKKK